MLSQLIKQQYNIMNCDRLKIFLIQLSFMNSVSDRTKLSLSTAAFLNDLLTSSQHYTQALNHLFNDQQLRDFWNALGLYISKNLTSGRGVIVPRFGTFSFTAPDLTLTGVTNPQTRDLQPRKPLFLISKQFVKGKKYKSAIFSYEPRKTMRPISLTGICGSIPLAKINVYELSVLAGLSKDASLLALQKSISLLSQSISKSSSYSIQLPNLGVLFLRKQMIGICFNQFLTRDVKYICSSPLKQRLIKRQNQLTKDNLEKFHRTFNSFKTTRSNKFMPGSPLARSFRHQQQSQTKQYQQNKSLKEQRQRSNCLYESLMSWICRNKLNSDQSFVEILRLSTGRQNKLCLIKLQHLWKALKTIIQQCNQQQVLKLFKQLDCDRDGAISLEDWRTSVNIQTGRLYNQLVQKVKHMQDKQLCQQLGVQQGTTSLSYIKMLVYLERSFPEHSQINREQLARQLVRNQYVALEKLKFKLMIVPKSLRSLKANFSQELSRRILKSLVPRNVRILVDRLRLIMQSSSDRLQSIRDCLQSFGVEFSLIQIKEMNQRDNLYNFIRNLTTSSQALQQSQLGQQQIDQRIRLSLDTIQTPLSVNELAARVKETNPQIPFHQLQDQCARFDRDEDQVIGKYDKETMREPLPAFKLEKGIIEKGLEQLKQSLINKRVSLYDFFNLVDVDKCGFINFKLFSATLQKFVKFSRDLQFQIFRFLDVNGTDIVDYKSFVDQMSGRKQTQGDLIDMKFVQNLIQRIRAWLKQNKLTLSESFKLFDQDSDGIVSKSDLKHFCTKYLTLKKDQITSSRLDKLYRLIDHYKRNRIDHADINLLATNTSDDWKNTAKQQLGIALSKKYGDPGKAFQAIAMQQNKITFQKFDDWCNQSKTLNSEFSNPKLKKIIFASLDPHKKGFVTEPDFFKAFGRINWQQLALIEIGGQLKQHFKSCKMAYRMFTSLQQSLTRQKFKKGIESILPNRFKSQQLNDIWNFLSLNAESISYDKFMAVFFKKLDSQRRDIYLDYFPTDSFSYISSSHKLPHTKLDLSQRFETTVAQVIQKLRRQIRLDQNQLKAIFRSVDKQQNGLITNLQFKNAARNFNIGLTSIQIDVLINACQIKSGFLIDWKYFLKLLKKNKLHQMASTRIADKIKTLSDDFYCFMISPTQAFKLYNNQHSGKMSFLQFVRMIKDLHVLSQRNQLQVSVIRYIFDQIDSNQDGTIEIKQFNRVFVMQTQKKQFTMAEQNKIINMFGKNRKFFEIQLGKEFKDLRNVPLSSFLSHVNKLQTLLRTRISKDLLKKQIIFATLNSTVDVQLILQNFKERLERLKQFPKSNIQ